MYTKGSTYGSIYVYVPCIRLRALGTSVRQELMEPLTLTSLGVLDFGGENLPSPQAIPPQIPGTLNSRSPPSEAISLFIVSNSKMYGHVGSTTPYSVIRPLGARLQSHHTS